MEEHDLENSPGDQSALSTQDPRSTEKRHESDHVTSLKPLAIPLLSLPRSLCGK